MFKGIWNFDHLPFSSQFHLQGHLHVYVMLPSTQVSLVVQLQPEAIRKHHIEVMNNCGKQLGHIRHQRITETPSLTVTLF